MSTAVAKLVHDADGLNTGSPPAAIADDFVTPTERFFTRSHAAIPEIDRASWRLEVDGLVRCPLSLSWVNLAKLPRREVTATLVCAGLRRVEFLSLGPLPGELPWGPEPASTGRWSGVALADVLAEAGLPPEAAHIELVGLDQVERHGHRFGFGGSITVEKALGGDVILAIELNGAPLSPTHGAPVRALVPGWIGARSIKWLGRITALAGPSENYFQTKAYRIQRQADPSHPRDVSAGTALAGVPLNAVILDPAPEQRIAAGRVRIRGWALGAEAAAVRTIELSPDDGHTWIDATVTIRGSQWTWTFWEATVELGPGRHTLVVRATDQSGALQPPNVRDTWNVKGYGNNAWHRVTVEAR